MEKYRIYKTENGGYEKIYSNLTEEQMYRRMDSLVSAYDSGKILVIGHDYDQNFDFPAYLHTGDNERYLEFKNNGGPKIKVKRRT